MAFSTDETLWREFLQAWPLERLRIAAIIGFGRPFSENEKAGNRLPLLAI